MPHDSTDTVQGCFAFDTVITPMKDGYFVRPGRLRRAASSVSVEEARKLTGYSKRHMQRIARELGAGQRKRGAKLWIPQTRLHEMLKELHKA